MVTGPAALLVAVMLSAGTGGAGERQVKVEAGRSASLDLPFRARVWACEDPTVVRVSQRGAKRGIRLVGLKAGTTSCSFAETDQAQRVVVEVVVVATLPATESATEPVHK